MLKNFFFFTVVLFGLLFTLPNKVWAQIWNKTVGINISALIGGYHFSLFGYTSPAAQVALEGMGISEKTTADKTGYFAFNNSFSPLVQQEVCLSAVDQFGRTSPPVCLPSFPIKYDVSIGPVLMPPTISLDAVNYWQGDEIKLSGQTIPNSQVNFSTFVDEKRSLFDYLAFKLIKPVEAFTFPQLSTITDDKGNFSLMLPSSLPQFLRIFAQTNYFNANSAASIILNLKVAPTIHLLQFAIIAELAALAIFFLRRYSSLEAVAKNRALTLRQNILPETQEQALMLARESKRSI